MLEKNKQVSSNFKEFVDERRTVSCLYINHACEYYSFAEAFFGPALVQLSPQQIIRLPWLDFMSHHSPPYQHFLFDENVRMGKVWEETNCFPTHLDGFLQDFLIAALDMVPALPLGPPYKALNLAAPHACDGATPCHRQSVSTRPAPAPVSCEVSVASTKRRSA